MAEEKKAFFTYKGVPLVRKGNNIYFGNMYDEFVVMIEILSTEKVGGIDVANKVRIRKVETDSTLPPNKLHAGFVCVVCYSTLGLVIRGIISSIISFGKL